MDSVVYRRLSDNALLKKERFSYQVVYPVSGDQHVNWVQKTSYRKDHYDYGVFAFTRGMDYRYDDWGNESMVINYTDISYSDSVLYTLKTWLNDTTHWDLKFMTSSIEARDSLGQDFLSKQQLSYDSPSLNLIKAEEYDDQQARWNSHRFGYDDYGNRTSIVDMAGDSTLVSFENVYHSFKSGVTFPANDQGLRTSISMESEPAFGKMTSHTDENGNQRKWEFDDLGRLTTEMGPDSTGSSSLITYKTINRQLNTPCGYYAIISERADWSGDTWTWHAQYLDGLQRRYRSSFSGSDTSETRFMDKVLDSKGRTLTQSVPYFSGASQIYYNTTQYDEYGRIVRVSHPFMEDDSTVTDISYQNKSIFTHHAVGTSDSVTTISRFEYYKGKKKMVCQVAADGDSTRYNFDLLGRKIGSTDPVGLTTNSSYSSSGKLISHTDPSLGLRTFAYDDSLRTAQSTDAMGHVIIYFHRWQ